MQRKIYLRASSEVDYFSAKDDVSSLNARASAKRVTSKYDSPVTKKYKNSDKLNIERYPCARFPDQIFLGDIVPLEVIIKSFKPSSSNYKSTTSVILQKEDENQKEIPVQVILEC